MDIAKLIEDKRPHLNPKSIKTYSSIIRSIMNAMGYDDVKQLNKTKEVMEYLKDLPPNKRKTRLSALLVITENDNYKKQMLEDINEFNGNVKKQEKSENEKKAWLSKDAILDIYKKLKKNAYALLREKDLTMKDLQEIQNFVLLALFVLIPPRRALDFTEMKISNVDVEKDNYIKGKEMIFNVYKTSKNKGQDKINIPKELKLILNKWIKINPTDYLLFDTKGQKLSSVKINQRFNKIMGKPNFSVNMFRHIFLTDKYKDTMMEMKNLEDDLKDMGSSMKQATTYVKLDD